MARVTAEDCVIKVPNRFELVLLASQRARELAVGGEPTVDRDNDKNPVIALREIADETIDIAAVRESLVQGLQKHADVDELEEDASEMLDLEESMLASLSQAGADFSESGEAEGDESSDESDVAGDDEPLGDEDSSEDDTP